MPTITTATVANGLLYGSDAVQYSKPFVAPNGDTIAAIVSGTGSPNGITLWNCTRNLQVGYWVPTLRAYGIGYLGGYFYVLEWASGSGSNGVYRVDISALDFTAANGNLTASNPLSRVVTTSSNSRNTTNGWLAVDANSGGTHRVAFAEYYLYSTSRNQKLYVCTVGGSAYSSGGGQSVAPEIAHPWIGAPIVAHDGNLYWMDGDVFAGATGNDAPSHGVAYLYDWANAVTANSFLYTATALARLQQVEGSPIPWQAIRGTDTDADDSNHSVTHHGSWTSLYARDTSLADGSKYATLYSRVKKGGDFVCTIAADGSFSSNVANAAAQIGFQSAAPSAATDRLAIEWGATQIRCSWAGGAWTTANVTTAVCSFRVTYDGDASYTVEYNAGGGWITLQTYAVGSIAAPYLYLSSYTSYSAGTKTATFNVSEITWDVAASGVYGIDLPIENAKCFALAGSGASKTMAVGFETQAWLARLDETTPGVSEKNGTVRGSYANAGGTYNVLPGNPLSVAMSSDAEPGVTGVAAFGTDTGIAAVDLSKDTAFATLTTADGLPSDTISMLAIGGADDEYVGGTPSGAFFIDGLTPPSGAPGTAINPRINAPVAGVTN